MTMYGLLQKKKRGERLSAQELRFFVEGFTNGEIPDYQAAAFCMAVYFRGMDKDEAFDLTAAMTKTGKPYNVGGSSTRESIADKHSTGGVSDATTLILAPVIALSGIKFLKMSGRGLGHTGGTVDKLESIPGFKTGLSSDEAKEIINATGAVIIGQSEKSAPADKMLYALRDVTATVDSIPLIAASIMSKKLLSPANILVLDVKWGGGAFMKTKKEAEELAAYMEYIGNKAGRKVSCVITENNEPTGRFIGNALELYGAIEILEGAENQLAAVSRQLAQKILVLGGFKECEAADFVEEQIKSGAAKKKLAQIIAAQGGDPSYITNSEKLLAKYTKEITSKKSGVIKSVDCEGLGFAAAVLGAGRMKKEDAIDYGAGIEVFKRIGDSVKVGDILCKVYYNGEGADSLSDPITDCFEVI